MKKPISRKSLIKRMDSLVSEIVRKRDKMTCQHCGKRVKGSNAHVSHVIPKSAGHLLRWNLKNVKLLCFHCHIDWWHKNPIEAYEWFVEKFPERAVYLEERKKEPATPIKTFQLEGMYAGLKTSLANGFDLT